MAKKYKMVNDKLVELTEAEETTRDAEEKAWADGKADRDLKELRLNRNILLAETDWMANSDVTMSTAWKNYRQALRDITKTYKSINDDGFTFPEKPTE
tara:strand:+ start:632 stop:925 length:294 start_codon:yes stop_codon:yes gene_type:complete